MFKKEYLIATGIGIAALIFSNLYLFYGLVLPKEGLSYLGRRVINSQDTYTYVAFIEQARQGKILFENLYTTEPQSSTLIRPSYALLGGMASVMGISSIAAYHIGRLLFSIGFFVVLYIFLRQFFKTPKRRLLAFTVTLTSTGIGLLVGAFWSQSADLWIPESLTFLSLQEAPHFILSQTLMLVSFTFLLKGFQKERVKYFVFAFIPLVFLGFEHPYNLFICAGTAVFTGGYLWITKKVDRRTIILGVSSILLGLIVGNLYQFIETLRNPTLGSWAAQSNSPSPVNYLFGYGFLIVFALIGLERYLNQRKLPQVFLVAWVAATFILLYSPVFFQRRLVEGLHIPLSILATEGIILTAFFLSKFVLSKAKKYVVYSAAIFIVACMGIGTINSVFADVNQVRQDSVEAYYYYILNSEANAMIWLRENTNSSDMVLSNWFYGNILPGVTGRTVYLGHKAQTKDFEKKVANVNKFILNTDTKSAYKFLKDNGITYVYVGANDSMLSYGFKPEKKSYLVKVFDEGNVRIYKVR